MIQKRLQVFSFLGALLLVFILVLVVLQPFVNILALSVIVTIMAWPLHRWLLVKTKSPHLAAGLSVLIILLALLIPVLLFGQILVNELVNVYNDVKSGSLVIRKTDIIQSLPSQMQGVIETASRDLNSILSRFTSSAFETVSGLLSNVAGFFLALFLVFFSVYYMLKDGHKIKSVLMDLSPIASAQEDVLFTKIVSAIHGVVMGSFLIAILQGIVATVGFFIFGVPQPILWGIVTIIAALVPSVGTALVLVPAITYLAVTGHVGAAIGLTIWGVVAVGLIDNFLSPNLIGSKIKLHPLLVLLSVLGGIQFFGFLGFLFGPILLAIFVAMVDIYRTDFKDVLEK